MELFILILVMLAAIGLSNIINHIVPFVPVPLIQIALGIALAMIPGGFDIRFEPELFFVLFIAPLLFNDGKRVSRKALWNLRSQILLLALGLVFLTVLVIGYITHWLIPSIPISAAFALAAILSPTDIVAVGAMSSRLSLPEKVMNLLEGEGLMNDASGLVAFNFAVAATVTGVFSITDASLTFLKIALGGFAVGSLLAFLIIRLRIFIRRMGMEDVTFHMLIQILTPFVIYMAAENFHFSGILAVVAAGIVHAIEHDHEESPNIDLQLVSKSTWNVLIYVLNGLVFILLGLQVPHILNEIFRDPSFNNVKVIGYTMIITASLFLIRFIWMITSGWISWKLKSAEAAKLDVRTAAIATVSGVRGSVTLAGAFSIPFVLADGSLFPERSLIIFIAAGVILLTLAAASILLPVITITAESEGSDDRKQMEKNATLRSKEAAIRATREAMDDGNREAAMTVISGYNRMLHRLKSEESEASSKELKKIETDIRLNALEAQYKYIEKLAEERKIVRETVLTAQAQIRRMEVAATNQPKFRILVAWTLLNNLIYNTGHFFMPGSKELKKRRKKNKQLMQIKINLGREAIRALKGGLTPENKGITYMVIGEYNDLITKIKSARNEEYSMTFAEMERELQEQAFQAERDEIQRLYENGKITKAVTQKLRQKINIREAYFLEENPLE
jgi:monovalent cation/hydrogen antiporter